MKRYDIAQARAGGVMVEDEEGDYVRYEDIAHLLAPVEPAIPLPKELFVQAALAMRDLQAL